MAGPSPSPFAFVNAALDRAEYLRTDPSALRALWPKAQILQVDTDGYALGDIHGPHLRHFPDEVMTQHTAVFLGLRAGDAWFALPTITPIAAPRLDLRSAAAHWPVLQSTAFAQARAILHWRTHQRHCGRCGHALHFVRAGWLGRCAACGSEHYPRTDPAVIAAVSDGQRLLLGRNHNWPSQMYSTLAGFVEPGETLEQALIREVWEEAAIHVTDCQYLASQPWPFPSSLMLGFLAKAEPGTPHANEELEDVRWFNCDDIGAALADRIPDRLCLSPTLSISRWLIETWHTQTANNGLAHTY